MTLSQDEIFMREALAEAKVAFALGEVPVGAVVVREGQIIARGHNRREIDRLATAHAELLAMEAACRAIGSWRLSDCTLYVTLEPCPMCAGTVVNARMGRVVYGAKDAKAGAMGSVLSVNAYPLNHKAQVTAGVLEQECVGILREFFESKRKK
ncbi:MAG: tRNA adenosine(34) deaminase TadA [Clostridia bacterium]|nr:tRNA adenosine(34) deaminase TadA [Clostridia bacterium]